jgi:hypothetical protein
MSVLREQESAWDEHRETRGIIKDYSLQHRVEIQWDLNDESKQERMFKLTVDDYEVILDLEEFLRKSRWV